MSWPKASLGEVADFRLGKMLDRRKNRGTLRPYLANVNVRWGRFDLENLREMRFEDHEIEKYGLAYGDIVMCEGGEPGRCALWKVQRPGMMIQKALHRIRAVDGVSNEFLFYNLFYRGRAGLLAPLFTGATIRHLPREKLAKVEVDVPPITTQLCIASILSAYDDLIENNRRRIQLLARAARLLYREWFVRFRFPGHDRTAIATNDGVPEGWVKRTLDSVSVIVMGQSPRSQYYNEDGDGLPFHQGVRGFGSRFPVHRVYSTVGKRVAEQDDILFSVRAPVGRINIAPSRLVLGRGLGAIRSTIDHQAFLYYALKNQFVKEDMMGSGTVFAAITKNDLHRVRLLHPPYALLERFTALVGPMDRQIEGLHQSIDKLTQARDLLLPRLMNGEIRV